MALLPLRRPSLAAAVLLFGVAGALAPVAQAQEDDYEDRARATNAISGGAAAASERARQKREQKKADKEQSPPMFPGATRAEPKAQSSKAGAKHLQKMIELLDKKDFAGVDTELQALLAESGVNEYDRSFGYQVAANAASDASQLDKALGYFQKALESNGLDNNGHFQVMYNLAVVQFQAGKTEQALATLDRYLAETKDNSAERLGFKAGLLADLKRTNEAVAILEGLLAQNPGDKKTLMNVVSLYQQAGQDAKATALLNDAFAKGLLATAQEYRTLYVGYIMDGKLDDALRVIDAGIAKGIVTPSPDLARDYAYIAQTAYSQNKVPMAIDLFKRAAPMAADGEVWLNLARVYSNEKRISDAKTAAKEALAKGVKKPQDAQRIIDLPGK